MATVARHDRAAHSAREVRHSRSALRAGIDATQIVFGVSGGVEVYYKTLVRSLQIDRRQCTPIVIARPDQRAHLRGLFGRSVKIHCPGSTPAGLATRVIRRMRRALGNAPEANMPPSPPISFRDAERHLRLDVLHSPVQIFSDVEFHSPGVLNLHDLQHVHFPENFTAGDLDARNRLYAQSARHAAAIIASSEFVRNDIIRHLNVPPDRVHVIPVACHPDVLAGAEKFGADQARREYDLPESFIFFPAQFWPHKNHARLVEALSLVRSRAPKHDLKLVCAGCRRHSGWPGVEAALDRFGMRDHVRFLDFIPTEHLAGLYRASLFCVMPSLFEASSYPVIEAQSLGVAAMCSDVTSLPELMRGNAGLLFDPRSAEDIAEKIQRWLDDPVDRLEHALRGREQATRNHSLAEYSARVLGLYAHVTRRDTDV